MTKTYDTGTCDYIWTHRRPACATADRCAECGRLLTEDERILCDDCEGEAFAEDEWIEEGY